MQTALAALPGVRHVDVDFEKKQALVTVTKSVDSQELIAALEEEGYGGSVKDIRHAKDESESSEPSDETADTPPLPGLSVDQGHQDSTKTTYSSPSFAEHIQISVSLDHDVLRPGDSFRIAVVLDVDDGWHIYGNPLGPGIGLETIVSTQEADGFDFEPARYAPAHRADQDFGEAGKTWVWELTGRTVQFLSGKVRDDVPPGEYPLTIDVTAQVCMEEACFPGKATLPLPVTVVTTDAPSHAAHSELFESFDKAHTP